MATNVADYEYVKIEAFWQDFWDKQKTFHAPTGSKKPKYYILDMFPYPSGAGLHAGHCENYTGSDILDRYLRAKGHNVLHPMGWDAFGLPAEQYAVKTGTHPSVTTAQNISNFTSQIKKLGSAIDWDREINTTDPHYFRWTQWIFLQLFKHGLAYVDERPVWWCPALGTVLANEEVVDGVSEVGGHPVERRALRQWVLRITAYADRLLSGLDSVEWPESTKTQQKNWIGRSEGAEVQFAIDGHSEKLTIYTTRPDTLFGVTYMVLAPEHPFVAKLTSSDRKDAVEAYIKAAASKSDLARTELNKDKSGVFTGSFAINPVNGAKVPIWIADYVLMSYGTGAIMAVPAHDERDYEFAKVHNIPVIRVVNKQGVALENADTEAPLPFCETGVAVNSDAYSGLNTEDFKKKITADLAAKNIGKSQVQYRLRDWLFSRQRYWGEPFPIVWVDENAYSAVRSNNGPVASLMPKEPVCYNDGTKILYALPVPEAFLPLELPKVENYKPAGTGESPLANAPEWVNVWFNCITGEARSASITKPDGAEWHPARRETNTMPQWAGSCWYYLRYCDPANPQALISQESERYWGVPDFYMGGAEHAVLHLLYARFWHQFLYDIGVVTTPEPFKRLYHQGIILGEDGEKMSKSRGNVINPDDYFQNYGADSLRLYLMFMGPLEDAKPWSSQGVEGVHRFLRRFWRELIDKEGKVSAKVSTATETNDETLRLLHETIKKVTQDIERLRYNTAISQMMIFLNHLQKVDSFSKDTAKTFVQLLAPFAPHICEELWSRLGEQPSVAYAPWPSWNESLLVAKEVAIGLLINGKPRSELRVHPEAPEADVLALAKADVKAAPFMEGKSIRKVVYVPGKIINLVVG